MVNSTIDPFKIREREAVVAQEIAKKRDNVFKRFPMTFTLLGTFGLVAVFYGLERLIDKVALLSDNPIILLGVGMVILLFTGTLYKRLG